MKRKTINKKLIFNNKTKRKNKRKLKSKNKRKTNKKIKGGANNPLTVTVTSLPGSEIDIEGQVIPVENKKDNIHNVIAEAYGWGKGKVIEVYFGGYQVDSDESIEKHGIEDGARLEVTIRDRFTIRQIITHTLELNPHLTEKKLKDGVIFNKPVAEQVAGSFNYGMGAYGARPEREPEPEPDFDVFHINQLKWSFPTSKLRELPPSFCDLIIDKKLDLSFNNLTSLPENFGSLSIGRDLDLDLSFNELTSLPDSFGSLRVGGDLLLMVNKLVSLPESFCSLRIVGDLRLDNNQLTSLPDSFGSLRVGGNLNLSHNKLTFLPEPESLGRVGGDINLNNQLPNEA